MWRQTERGKNKKKPINSSDIAVAVTDSFLEIPWELIHVNMDSDSKNLITLGEAKESLEKLHLTIIDKCLWQ